MAGMPIVRVSTLPSVTAYRLQLFRPFWCIMAPVPRPKFRASGYAPIGRPVSYQPGTSRQAVSARHRRQSGLNVISRCPPPVPKLRDESTDGELLPQDRGVLDVRPRVLRSDVLINAGVTITDHDRLRARTLTCLSSSGEDVRRGYGHRSVGC
jgi:hypothetical protein